MEVIVTPDRGPVLVEANAGRWNGEEFALLADACVGYNAYDAWCAAMLDEGAWGTLPPLPPDELRACGRLVKLVSPIGGKLRALRHSAEIEALPSLIKLRIEAAMPGDTVVRTTDLNTCAGDVFLLHPDAAVVAADYAALRRMQPTMWEVEPERGAGAQPSLSSSARLQLEAAEAIRIAAAVAAASLGRVSARGDDASPAELTARFPLIGDFTLSTPRGCAAAELGATALGDRLLRGLRTAQTEADVEAAFESLFAVPPPAASASGSASR